MVDGRNKPIGCIVVDLDNSLIMTNSTRELAKFTFLRLLKKLKIADAISIAYKIALRKIRVISHAKMKHSIIRATLNNLSDSDIESFTAKLTAKINPKVKELIEISEQNGNRVLIATAAADFFLPLFIKSAKINADYIGTPYTDNIADFLETRKNEKLNKVRQYLADNNLAMEIFITDHHDDMPLLAYNPGKNYIVSPSASTIRALTGIQFEILR